MARILVTAMPFAGHVAPITGVVEHLIGLGHEVTVYTGSRHASRFEALGARPIPWAAAPDFDERDLRATFPEVGRRGPLGLLANLEHVFIRTGEGQAHDLLTAHASTPFDVIAGDVMSLGAGLTTEVAGIPWATLSIVPLSSPSRDLPPSGLALHRRSCRRRRAPRAPPAVYDQGVETGHDRCWQPISARTSMGPCGVSEQCPPSVPLNAMMVCEECLRAS